MPISYGFHIIIQNVHGSNVSLFLGEVDISVFNQLLGHVPGGKPERRIKRSAPAMVSTPSTVSQHA